MFGSITGPATIEKLNVDLNVSPYQNQTTQWPCTNKQTNER